MSEVKFRELRNTPPMVVNFAKAVLRATVKPGSNPTLPDVGLRLNDVSLDEKHLAAYRKVCGFAADGKLPVTYPHMHAFPLHMALILTDGFPFPAMGLVHVRNSITQYRPIAEREQLNVKCFLGNLQKVDKGYEFSIFTSVSTGGERVWESESVNFFRSGGGNSSKKKNASKPQPATDTVEWKVPGDIGRRYGAVSGDRNPIHLYPLSAKLFGFKRHIAHGMWSKARCLAELQYQLPENAFTVDVQFKLPMFVPATVKFENKPANGGSDFRLLAKDGIKPHLAGQIRPAK
ncbi:acyl dehydratase MaoC [Alcanivorax sp. NBRC 101098]|uniref:MaoC family dehydratase n=1 Tax=Alcanivorax sp. NBRC 101098 TaxID=1113728 RepID=UPI0004ABED54|nr:MaoC/PaaZ C-terminal domain-containing protein [Alcanivorax sp. NBRC 101098]BAP14626.1 acyl dehydratase MaoC [Alcanivorax sp. NBRC 101098]